MKKRSVLGVHEHFSPTSNAAIGQKTEFWGGSSGESTGNKWTRYDRHNDNNGVPPAPGPVIWHPGLVEILAYFP